MENFITQHFETILGFISGLFAGGVGVHFFEKRNSDNNTIKNVRTGGGDFAGRDMHK